MKCSSSPMGGTQMKKQGTRLVIALLVLTLAVPVRGPGAFATDPQVLLPQSQPFGATYGEWSARWWRWVVSLPADRNPLDDTAECSEGQRDHVWFLGGTYTPVPAPNNTVVGRATRQCHVPADTALFFPIVNAECSKAEDDGATEAELRECAEDLVDHAIAFSVEVDGQSIDLARFRRESSLFRY